MINELFDRFENVAAGVEDDLRPGHVLFGRRQLHPLLLCSPFVYRTFAKPLGYAGDYEMVNMMFSRLVGRRFAVRQNGQLHALQLPPIIAIATASPICAIGSSRNPCARRGISDPCAFSSRLRSGA